MSILITKYKKFKLVWLGIKIEIRYTEPWMKHKSLTDTVVQVNHLEIMAPCPLPITATGYRSHFVYRKIENPVEFVWEWLEKEKKGVWLMLERSLGV